MKTTLEIPDALLVQAKRRARKLGKPLRALVEEGLRRMLEGDPEGTSYRLPDRSVGLPGAPNPLEQFSWPEIRDAMYGGR